MRREWKFFPSTFPPRASRSDALEFLGRRRHMAVSSWKKYPRAEKSRIYHTSFAVLKVGSYFYTGNSDSAGKQKKCHCKPLSLSDDFHHKKILWGTKNCHCSQIVTLTGITVTYRACITEQMLRRPQNKYTNMEESAEYYPNLPWYSNPLQCHRVFLAAPTSRKIWRLRGNVA